MSDRARKVLVVGATGTIGRACLHALLAAGHEVTCLVRRAGDLVQLPAGAVMHVGDVTHAATVDEAFQQTGFDAVVSCLASRTGTPKDAWAIDHHANLNVLHAARRAGVPQFILLSAICVQRPLLAFQQAKLAFEAELAASGLTWSIVRPTAFFKSLSGQLDRVKAGKPFLVFGDGKLTACKPISDADLADYIVGCLHDTARHNAILPIGGPGPAITPLDQAHELFRLLGQEPKIKRVPVAVISTIVAALSVLGKLSPKLAEKAELARIGRYYATQSMLVLDRQTGAYSAQATPEHGSDTLFAFYARLVAGQAQVERGEHAVF